MAVPLVAVLLGDFQKFDRGEPGLAFVEYAGGPIKPGDTVEWECGHNLSGYAKVLEVAENGHLKIQK